MKMIRLHKPIYGIKVKENGKWSRFSGVNSTTSPKGDKPWAFYRRKDAVVYLNHCILDWGFENANIVIVGHQL